MLEELQGESGWLLACDPETHRRAKLQCVYVCVFVRSKEKGEVGLGQD